MKRFTDEDRAVSPVIGVILMVAVTVILAAIVATFVMGMGDNVQENPNAAVTFDQNDSDKTVTVQVVSMDNAESVTVDDNDGNYSAKNGDETLEKPGDSVTIEKDSSDFEDGDTVTVTATLEGKDTVIQTYTYRE